jgi:hypothetical protein
VAYVVLRSVMLMFADTPTDGIAKPFPAKFKK